MTLTHALPSLRRTLPDPLHRDSWPEFTATTVTDVSICGLSMLRLVDWCQTPCVHTAAAVVPGTGGRPSPNELASVLMTRIEAITTSVDGRLEAWIDATLDGCVPVLSETRLIGRASTAHSVPVVVRPSAKDPAHDQVVELPGDLRVGDILVIPCKGVTALHDVRHGTSHPERLADERTGDDREWFPATHCDR